MKKLMMALVCLVVSVSANAETDCYQRLLRGGNDSVVHQMNVGDISPAYTLRSMTITGLYNLLTNCGCKPIIKKVQCGEAVKGNDLTEVCYAESNFGYFLVNRDYLDNINIIFNRWD